ncbi:MAG: hypothetical protein GF349_04340 [Candidatus Magasanikbacteria bacterium]|nr:hypothetical protein [Candidatus Magasanikbacteria bacterium]
MISCFTGIIKKTNMKLHKKILNDTQLQTELVGYFFVGILGAVIDFSIFYFAIYLDTTQIVAQWLGALSGFTHNHIWQHYKVFDHNQKIKKTYTLSLLIAIISIILSGPLLLFFNLFIPYLWMSKILVITCQFSVLFVLRKKLVFKKTVQ